MKENAAFSVLDERVSSWRSCVWSDLSSWSILALSCCGLLGQLPVYLGKLPSHLLVNSANIRNLGYYRLR
jgi:hypothetical protein